MEQKPLQKMLLILILFYLKTYPAQSQITIAGPACVKSGAEYHYTISRNNQTSAPYQVCVQGGIIKDAASNCLSQFSSSVIKIKWNNVTSGSITVSSTMGNQTFATNITNDLRPGELNPASLQQLIERGTIPDSLKCSVAQKGSCAPVYQYQWQLSQNKIDWQNIANGTGQHLKLTSPVNEPTYYRRRVTESNSGTIKYSGVATVYIIPGAG